MPRIVPQASPSEIPTLNVGDRATVSITVTVPPIALAGAYEAMLLAGTAETGALLGLRFQVPERAAATDGTRVAVRAGARSSARVRWFATRPRSGTARARWSRERKWGGR